LLPVVLISGIFFPASELPGWVARLADWLPVSHLARLLGAGFGGASFDGASFDGAGWRVVDVAWLAAWGAAALAFALARFRVEPPAPRTRRWFGRPAIDRTVA
jgi:ABC-type polysaccharide/polyol phosphate export permease